ncbi:Glycine--tRNA ligase beta subunit [Buchnera aphidicola (Tetraneura ulmi)]|uniref:glycine--tRNA ligase subunit beta n=1 Tax=Buchnera aphidicola TaxID=9 RepID=UPI003464C399
MKKKTLLIELGTEDLPAKKLHKISKLFFEYFKKELNLKNIDFKKIYSFATSRRLSIKVEKLFLKNKKMEIIEKGPSISNSFDNKKIPTLSALSWTKKIGIKIEQTFRLKNNFGEWIAYRKIKKRKKIQILLIPIIKKIIEKISFGKLMRWNETNQKFFRPIRNIAIILDKTIIPCNIFSIRSSRVIMGHRSLGKQKISIKQASEYPEKLIKIGKVIPCLKERKEIILNKIKIINKKINGKLKINEKLLEEITSLVEYPIVKMANFKKKFLILPKEIIIYTIEKEQKYFPIFKKNNKITKFFIFVSNIKSLEENKIIKDHEKVLNSRLSDAYFFFKKDQKYKLKDRLPLLKKVNFEKKLGNMFDKTNRIKKISEYISNKIEPVLTKKTTFAAIISKCDLISNMVKTYPELQGIIGMSYALNEGIEQEIAISIKEQYSPSFLKDNLPTSKIGSILSISDKIDLLTGMFYLKKYPSAEKDPFALRRAAIGIIRIMIKKKMKINLEEIIKTSFKLYSKKNDSNESKKKLICFFSNRYLDWYKKKGYETNIIKSVLNTKPKNPITVDTCIKIITNLKTKKKYNKLISLYKRIFNILKKSKFKIEEKINKNLFKNKEEKKLFSLTNDLEKKTNFLCKTQQHDKILINLINLNNPIEDFFKITIINDKNKKIKNNRLNLLNKIKKLFFYIADFSLL